MPYDPQRSHRRPRLADDAPAPIDALLGDRSEEGDNGAGEPVGAPVSAEPETHEPAAPDTQPAWQPQTAARPASTEVEIPAPSRGGRSRWAVLAVVLLVLVLVGAWLRRRRR